MAMIQQEQAALARKFQMAGLDSLVANVGAVAHAFKQKALLRLCVELSFCRHTCRQRERQTQAEKNAPPAAPPPLCTKALYYLWAREPNSYFEVSTEF